RKIVFSGVGRQGKVITVGDNVFIIPDSLQHYWLTAG
ncbi:hypothetical protein LTSEUGA_1986, partial [Salmonella enterica subsp. enterica serovar Uganda str. R8-3404]